MGLAAGEAAPASLRAAPQSPRGGAVLTRTGCADLTPSGAAGLGQAAAAPVPPPPPAASCEAGGLANEFVEVSAETAVLTRALAQYAPAASIWSAGDLRIQAPADLARPDGAARLIVKVDGQLIWLHGAPPSQTLRRIKRGAQLRTMEDPCGNEAHRRLRRRTPLPACCWGWRSAACDSTSFSVLRTLCGRSCGNSRRFESFSGSAVCVWSTSASVLSVGRTRSPLRC